MTYEEAKTKAINEEKYLVITYIWNDETQESDGREYKVLNSAEFSEAEENFEIHKYLGFGINGTFEQTA